MGTLKDFDNYLKGRVATVKKVEGRLCKLQEKYETFFSEVSKVREGELQQLTEHILEDRGKLPDAFNTALDRAQMEVEREFDAELKRLTEERAALLKKAEQARQASIKGEQAARKKNVDLDQQEEALKTRNEALLAEIARFNEEIRGLGRGFGFFANLFKMRGLTSRRQELNAEQADVAARIDALRARSPPRRASCSSSGSIWRPRWAPFRPSWTTSRRRGRASSCAAQWSGCCST